MRTAATIDEQLEEAFRARTPESSRLHQEARQFTPLGVHSYVRFYEPYPIYVREAKGTRIVDADGNTYIDFSMNYGAQLAGHAHPLIVEAVKEQAERGTLYTMPHEHEIALAREIVKRFPIEQVRFTNSGAEATMHALRVARGHTGRDKIIKVAGGYHGVHDALLTKDDPADAESRRAVPSSQGIPMETMRNVLMGIFNDLDSIDYLFSRYEGEIAAVILEPVLMNRGIILPQDGFLQGLRELCEQNGALLIFDEVKTGVKIAWGGATEYYGVKPDILCLSKSIGGGLPIGAFGASREIMATIESGRVTHAGTFSGNPLSVVAAVVTLRDVLTRDSYKTLFRLNTDLATGYDAIIGRHGLAAHVVSIGACGTIHFCNEPLKDHRDVARVNTAMAKRYWLGTLTQGIIPCPYPPPREQWTISVQHTDEDIDKHLQVFEGIAPVLREDARLGTREGW